MSSTPNHILAFSGGVGGAKLALGLYRCLEPEQLTIVANTGDDFEYLGLNISPDLDTVMYTLAGVSNTELGWGLAGESWNFLAALETLGADSWFRLGDRDLATHVCRTEMLRAGSSLSEITQTLASRLGVLAKLLPMTDDPVTTQVSTEEGVLPFQQYFVKRQCQPAVDGFEFSGIESAVAQPQFMQCLQSPALKAIIICPSNPFVSVDPILQLAGVREAMKTSVAPVIAVSPIVAGMAIKGPAAKMMAELNLPVTAEAVARHYVGLIDCFVVDESDAKLVPEIAKLGMRVAVAPTIMTTMEDRENLANLVLQLAGECS